MVLSGGGGVYDEVSDFKYLGTSAKGNYQTIVAINLGGTEVFRKNVRLGYDR